MKWLIIALISISFTTHAETPKVAAKAAQKKNKPASAEKPKNEGGSSTEAWDRYRDTMIVISRQMGVTCTHCHDSKNYRDASKPTFPIAKKHMEMVDMMNAQFKSAFTQRVDCYMCHRGQAIPDYKEKSEKF
jgi:hypothetical protein